VGGITTKRAQTKTIKEKKQKQNNNTHTEQKQPHQRPDNGGRGQKTQNIHKITKNKTHTNHGLEPRGLREKVRA